MLAPCAPLTSQGRPVYRQWRHERTARVTGGFEGEGSMQGATSTTATAEIPHCAPIGGYVLIVEDHPMAAEATANLLRLQHPAIHPVTVETAAAALAYSEIPWFRIFVDLEVPGATRLSLIHEFKTRGLVDRCCIISGNEDEELIREARQLGVLGFIGKRLSTRELGRALDDVIRGVPVFPVMRNVPSAQMPQLTRRQVEVLLLLKRGLSNKEIALELGITEGTAKNHISFLMLELGENKRMKAVRKAIEYGLIKEGD
jgi:DNA-binding NarL/FixJ family response regulator